MIDISVKYAGLPRSESGKRQETWPVKEGATLEELLEAIAAKYRWDLGGDSRFVVVYNNYGLDRHQWREQELQDKDLVLILSSISGG